MTLPTYTVISLNQARNDKRSTTFGSYKKALDYYFTKCDEVNIDFGDVEQPLGDVEVNLRAGGRVYDYIIELIVGEELI